MLDNIRQLDQGTRTVRHTYDSVNRLDTIKNAAGTTLSSYNFDTRGNLSTRTTGSVTDTFTFDKANRLKATTINGVSSVYGYDGLGRRMQQTEAGVSSYFVYGQAGQLLFSQDATTRYNHIHLAGSLVAKRLVPFSGTTSIRYQHTDALGSPVAETNEAGVLYLPRERMTAYGEPADGTWQAGPGFTGHQMDASSKLVYMQQRYYDPVSGRFLSADPMASDMQNGWNFNRYNYAANNPYRFNDPDGRRITNLSCGMVCRKQRELAEEERRQIEEAARDERSDLVRASRLMQRRMQTSDTGGSRQMSIELTISPGTGVSIEETEAYADVASNGWNVSIVGSDQIVRTFSLSLTVVSKRGDLRLSACSSTTCPGNRGAAEVGGRDIYLGRLGYRDTPVHEFGHVFGFASNRANGTGSIMSGDSIRSVTQGDFDLLWEAYRD